MSPTQTRHFASPAPGGEQHQQQRDFAQPWSGADIDLQQALLHFFLLQALRFRVGLHRRAVHQVDRIAEGDKAALVGELIERAEDGQPLVLRRRRDLPFVAATLKPGTGKGLRVECEALADLPFAFPWPWFPRQVEAIALEQLPKRRDRLAVGRAGFLAPGMAELLMDSDADAKFKSLRQTTQRGDGERFCHSILSIHR